MCRDKTIDRLRAFAMLWVILVHVLYWGNFFTNQYFNLLKSFCLFEMPLLFFITGASNNFSKVNSYLEFVRKRFQRVLIPYWVFAIICAIISIFKYRLECDMDFFTGIKVLLSWLVPVNRQMTSVSYLTWALWFIPVYLCVVLAIPGLKHMKRSERRIEFAFMLLGLFWITCLLQMGYLQNVTFYSFWTYIGLFYSDIKLVFEEKHNRKYFLYIVVAGIVTICICYFVKLPIDMQSNKFPPNLIFLVFSIMMMTLIMLILPYLDRSFVWMEKYKFVGRILDLFSTRSMTIFLYQVFAFNLTVRIANILIQGGGAIVSITKAVFCLLASIFVCAGLAAIFGRIEQVGNKAKGNNK